VLDKVIRSVAKGVGEVVATPLTVTNAVVKAVVREVDKATGERKS
jgi:hypothetical protein